MKKPRHLKRLAFTMHRGTREHILPADVTQAIGIAVTRHAVIETCQTHILAALLGMKLGHARLVLRLNRSHGFIQAVKTLVRDLRINVRTKWATLEKSLSAAERARNNLAHSIFIKPKKKLRIILTAASWELGEEYEPVSRAIIPEAKNVSWTFLRSQLVEIEKAVRSIEAFEKRVKRSLQALNEKRRTKPELDRRLPKN